MQTATALDILLVDDDGPLREMLTRSFEREGHRVTAVADGDAALKAAGDRLLRPGSTRSVGRRVVNGGHGPHLALISAVSRALLKAANRP